MTIAYLMCGPQGAGKSTKASEIAKLENATIISGDEIRKELYGSAEIQGNWVAIHDRIEECLADVVAYGQGVILDGTYHKRSYREEAITLLKSYGYDRVEAIVCFPSLSTCMARNWSRERNVPDFILKATYESFQRGSKDILKEGFSRVTFVY
jgi:predicted kinase